MSAAAERRALTAYTLYEGLMRAVNAEDSTEAMDIEGSEALTPQLLLGGHEPSKEEEDLWFQERSRYKIFIYSHVPSHCHASSADFQSHSSCHDNHVHSVTAAEMLLSLTHFQTDLRHLGRCQSLRL